jgi:hypothetical protein
MLEVGAPLLNCFGDAIFVTLNVEPYVAPICNILKEFSYVQVDEVC